MLGNDGASKGALTVIVAILAIAIVVVMFLWMQDRESQDVKLDIGSRATPTSVVAA